MAWCEIDDFSKAAFPETRWLTPGEREELARLGHPRRRREWAAARLALKRLLLDEARIRDPAEVAIRKNAQGRPRVVPVGGKGQKPPVWDCSLAHKGRYVMVAYTPCPGRRVGVDVERISARLARLAPRFAHSADRLMSPGTAAEYFTVLWALKEAAAKMTGEGFRACLGRVVCREVAPGRCVIHYGNGESTTGCFREKPGYVAAFVASGETGRGPGGAWALTPAGGEFRRDAR